MREKKNKKLTRGEGFTVANDNALGMSLGDLLGVETKKDSKPKDTKASGKDVSANKGAAKISKVSLRRERAGRGGKTVTVVTLPKDYSGDVAALAKELRKALGVGGGVEDGKIILQGDMTERAEVYFIKKGVKKVTKS